MYYECHITMAGDPEKIENAVKITDWKFSKIDGDPTLGKGIKCYATRHFNCTKNSIQDVIDRLNDVAIILDDYSVDRQHYKVIRVKVELVLYDHINKE